MPAAKLGEKDAVATIAVKSVEASRKFYADTLGLKEASTGEKGVLSFECGKSSVLVYESQFAGTNKATAATWIVGDELEAIVGGLKAKGVSFEKYDFPGMKREGEIHVGGNTRAAWFKDPDGNIIALVNG